MLGLAAGARGTQIGMVVPLAGFVVSWSFPLYLNLFKGKELDGYLKSKVGVEPMSSETTLEEGSEVREEFGGVNYEKGASRGTALETIETGKVL